MKEGSWLLVLALVGIGAVLLFSRRTAVHSRGVQITRTGGPKRYQNKEIRRVEYNADGLPTLIEITRDYTLT
jgi:hypothetical protein